MKVEFRKKFYKKESSEVKPVETNESKKFHSLKLVSDGVKPSESFAFQAAKQFDVKLKTNKKEK